LININMNESFDDRPQSRSLRCPSRDTAQPTPVKGTRNSMEDFAATFDNFISDPKLIALNQ